ncbi:MAG: glycosyl hydrolase, partial [Chloroflexota bacterium]
ADPNIIYAGTGEATIRIDVSHGDGVYKSTDKGRTWAHIGLENTRHIGKIEIHPDNPDVVFVAALGHAFGTNDERGVYRSQDGGSTWERVLFKSDKAGAIDISIDKNNPRIIYATIWEARRKFWDIISGGEDSSIWRSMDGGDTWEDISQNKGLPEGVLGKMGVAASPAKQGRVWALIENDKGGMYRSDDYGETWEFVADNENLISRAWYYMHVTADPVDGDTVYVNNLSFWKSTDGGRTYEEITTPHGDNHDVWLDPANPMRMVQGNDGGACVSFNGGASWSTLYNQPTAQFYHITADTRNPFNVYGTQQDNSSLAVPSRSPNTSITWTDCYLAGTAESGYIQVRPDNPDIVYVGAIGSSPGGGNSLQRYDHRTKQVRLITSYPEATRGEGASAQKIRFAWTYPILISPHNPDVLYIGGSQVLKSTNEGQSWESISPDLTVADPDTLTPSGRPINRDAVGAETYATVFSLCESLHEAGVLWAGSDDGLVHITRDGGANWENITPSDFQDWTMVTVLEPSPYDPATCYMSATRYKEDDYTPYIYKTSDFGKTWTCIDSGIREDDFVRVVRCDPEREGLLYAGTETGVYISYDDGANWQAFQLNLPVSPVHDLIVKEASLIAGTHGRSIWVIDDLNLIRDFDERMTQQANSPL